MALGSQLTPISWNGFPPNTQTDMNPLQHYKYRYWVGICSAQMRMGSDKHITLNVGWGSVPHKCAIVGLELLYVLHCTMLYCVVLDQKANLNNATIGTKSPKPLRQQRISVMALGSQYQSLRCFNLLFGLLWALFSHPWGSFWCYFGVSRALWDCRGSIWRRSQILVDFPHFLLTHFGVNFSTQKLQSRKKTEKSSVRNVAFKKFAPRAHPKQAKE